MNIKQLEEKIVKAYEEGVTVMEAEKLAGEFLHAQLTLSAELKKADLDSRMRKSGVKAVRAALYLDIVTKAEAKKPTEAQISATIDSNELVQGEQDRFDQADVDFEELKRVFDVCGNAHIHFRTLSKGRFE